MGGVARVGRAVVIGSALFVIFLLASGFDKPKAAHSEGANNEWFVHLPNYTPLDQGQLPACVGYAWAAWEMSDPHQFQHPLGPNTIYYATQHYDPWSDSNHDGTNGQSAAAVLEMYGYIANYRVSQRWQDARDYILSTGPVVFEAPWTFNMYAVDPRGYLKMGGDIAGGHEYLCNGYTSPTDTEPGYFTCLNSWGALWPTAGPYAHTGQFLISDTSARGLQALGAVFIMAQASDQQPNWDWEFTNSPEQDPWP